MTAIEYTIYEQPQPPPELENPTTDNLTTENPMQLNKEIQRTDLPKTDLSTTDLSNTHSIPILSPNPSPLGDAAEPERKGTEASTQSAVEIYREIIKDNIEYSYLLQDSSIDRDRLNEIVDLMLETVCTARKTIRIAGDEYVCPQTISFSLLCKWFRAEVPPKSWTFSNSETSLNKRKTLQSQK